MKPTKILLSIAILLLTVISVKAQDCECPEEAQINKTELTMIGLDDYVNFLSIEGLKKYSNINYQGLKYKSNKARAYNLSSYNHRISLDATYGRDGNLTKGMLVAKNYPLPKVIYDYLVTDNYKDWTMTSNKTIIHDFDALTTEYEVKIQRDKMKQTLFFDHLGNRITRLAQS